MNTVHLNEYTYPLPDDHIARYPLQHRDQSNLLLYRNGDIQHRRFFELPELLPQNTQLYFNDTKVIPARLHFTKPTGADIEIFLLHPVSPSTLMVQAMESLSPVSWQCTIGNLKRWTPGLTLQKLVGSTVVTASLVHREKGIVEFTWEGDQTFAELINLSGNTPLPPYLNRPAEKSDRERYQTVYSKYDGAVAAPTAGLHFTEEVLNRIKEKGIGSDFLTLHVSAGTFQPIKDKDAAKHIMHQEQLSISRKIIDHLQQEDTFTIAVGTTSMRTLESLYWFGAKLLRGMEPDFNIRQDDPYQLEEPLPSRKEAMKAITLYMNESNLDTLYGTTSIYILPGYTFRICQGLITNFHQPGSTLILLVAAFIGTDWKRIYQEALNRNYRFLSYGDSSLLIP